MKTETPASSTTEAIKENEKPKEEEKDSPKLEEITTSSIKEAVEEEEKENSKQEEEKPESGELAISSTTEVIAESTTSEAQTTISAVENESEKTLDSSEEESTTASEMSATESSTKILEEAKTTEATVSVSQKLTAPVPTQIDMILTTLKDLKEYVKKLDQAPETKVSELEPPATFVNFTVSRSIPKSEENNSGETQDIDEGTIRKRSVDLKTYYLKHTNKEKGCKVGTQFYKVGEEITTDDTCLDCMCYYSPIGHCIRNDKCLNK